MIRRWLVICQVNLCADKELKIIVRTNIKKKAELLAEKELYTKGYFHVKVISCTEITKEN